MRHSLVSLCQIVAIFAIGAFTILSVSAQTTRPVEQPAAEPSGPAPGLFNELGKLLKSPADLLPSLSKSESPKSEPPKSDAAPTTAAPAAPPVEVPASSTRLFPGMVTGREVCPRAANGAPDCQAGSDKLCQSKGYKSGKSLNTDSAYSCSTRQARADGRKPCGNEHFVTSAFCN